MNHEHFVAKCDHGTVVNQCRCADPSKSVRIVECPANCPERQKKWAAELARDGRNPTDCIECGVGDGSHAIWCRLAPLSGRTGPRDSEAWYNRECDNCRCTWTEASPGATGCPNCYARLRAATSTHAPSSSESGTEEPLSELFSAMGGEALANWIGDYLLADKPIPTTQWMAGMKAICSRLRDPRADVRISAHGSRDEVVPMLRRVLSIPPGGESEVWEAFQRGTHAILNAPKRHMGREEIVAGTLEDIGKRLRKAFRDPAGPPATGETE